MLPPGSGIGGESQIMCNNVHQQWAARHVLQREHSFKHSVFQDCDKLWPASMSDIKSSLWFMTFE